MTENKRFRMFESIIGTCILDNENPMTHQQVIDELNQLNDGNKKLKIENKKLYDENIQLRQKLLHFYQLKDDVEYLKEKGVF